MGEGWNDPTGAGGGMTQGGCVYTVQYCAHTCGIRERNDYSSILNDLGRLFFGGGGE